MFLDPIAFGCGFGVQLYRQLPPLGLEEAGRVESLVRYRDHWCEPKKEKEENRLTTTFF